MMARSNLSLALVALVVLLLALAPQHAEARGHANKQRLFEQLEHFAEQQEQQQHKAHRSMGTLSVSSTSSPRAVSAAPGNVTTEWFPQTLDHFEFSAEPVTWQQRFYSNMHFYKPGGPAFLYMGGEAELNSSSIASGEIVQLAMEHGGALFGLEHRFYGMSQPFPTLASENLRYLTIEQALEDAINFIVAIVRTRLPADTPVMTVGGSYPGTLSAWMRTRYPNIVAASLASSAPVHAQASFWEYDAVVAASAGPQCSDAIRNATHMLEALLDDPATEQSAKDLFGCGLIPKEDDVSFLYVTADAVAYAAQYTSSLPNSRNYHLLPLLCDRWMLNSSATGLDPVYSLASFFRDLMNRTREDCYSFSTLPQTLNDTSTAPDLNQRQWYWQSCLQVGYFQVAPLPSEGQPIPLRSSRIDLAYHLKMCKEVYGADMNPATVATNARYGGVAPVGSRVYYTSGSIDPWNALSLTRNLSCCSSLVARMINGTAHCADLYASDPVNDPPDLTAARNSVRAAVREWLSPTSQNIDCPMFPETSFDPFDENLADGGNRFRSCNGSCVDISNDVFHCGSCAPAADHRITADNAKDFYCRQGVLLRVRGEEAGTLTSRQMMIIGICFLVAGFVCMALGLHALRRVKTQRAIQKYDALEALQQQHRDEAVGGQGQQHGWNREAARPLRNGDGQPW